MTAGKAVALFVAWFALTVALFGVGVSAVTSSVPLTVYSLFEDEPHLIGRINDATILIFAGVLPIVIVAKNIHSTGRRFDECEKSVSLINCMGCVDDSCSAQFPGYLYYYGSRFRPIVRTEWKHQHPVRA